MGLVECFFSLCFSPREVEEADSPSSVSSLVVARDDPDLPIVYVAGRVGNPRIKATWNANPRQRRRRVLDLPTR